MSDLSLKEGTITFWLPKGFEYNDNLLHILIKQDTKEGSLFVIKDDDNKIKIFHVILDKGRTDIEFDVTKLSSNEKHMIAISWSLKSKELKFYLDGVQKVVKTIVTN